MDITSWKLFNIELLFHPRKCKCSNASSLLTFGNEIAYIGAKRIDNGVMYYVQRREELVTKGNCIVFIGDGQGSVGYCIYQPEDFIGSSTLLAGYNSNLNEYNAQFIISILNKERYRYSFGRKYNQKTIRKCEILLPSTEQGEVNWQFMEDYIKNDITNLLPPHSKQIWSNSYNTEPIN